MQSVIATFKAWQLHPFVDHFTVALILIGIVTDLAASIFSIRLWIRYMAVTLMVLGAMAAWGSNVTGGWEAGRVWDLVSGPGKDVLKRHAQLGDILPWVFTALAIWRLGVQFIGFISVTRPIYILVAILAGAAIVYQGHLGSIMVYDYGIGTASSATPAATISPTPLVQPTAEITSSPVPSLAPTPEPSTAPPSVVPSTIPTPATLPSAPPTPVPAPSASSSPLGLPSVSIIPPAESSAAPAQPSPGEPTAAPSPGAKNL